MALKIRLSRAGAKKRPFYRIVVADTRSPRDGRFIERLGTYNPLLPADHPERVTLKPERIKHWLDNGARPSDRVARFLGAADIIAMPQPRHNPNKAQPRPKTLERQKEKEAAAAAAAAQPPPEAPAGGAPDTDAAPAEEIAEEADAAPAEEIAEEANAAPNAAATQDADAQDAGATDAATEEAAGTPAAEDEAVPAGQPDSEAVTEEATSKPDAAEAEEGGPSDETKE